MKVYEEIITPELVVVRHAIHPSLAADLQAEWIDFTLGDEPKLGEQIARNEAFVFSSIETPSLEDLSRDRRFAATQRVVGEIGLYGASPDVWVGINYQSPFASQHFHGDRAAIYSVMIVHGADGGAFDYSPGARTTRQARDNYQTVELGAGDVVFQSMKWLHRGRNASEEPRVSVFMVRERARKRIRNSDCCLTEESVVKSRQRHHKSLI